MHVSQESVEVTTYISLTPAWQGPDKHIYIYIHIYINVKNIKL